MIVLDNPGRRAQRSGRRQLHHPGLRPRSARREGTGRAAGRAHRRRLHQRSPPRPRRAEPTGCTWPANSSTTREPPMSDTYHQVRMESRGGMAAMAHPTIIRTRPASGWSPGRKYSGHRNFPTTTLSKKPCASAGSTAAPAASAPTVPRCWSPPANPPATGPAATSSERRQPDRRRAHAPRRARRRRRRPGQRQLGRPRTRGGPDRARGPDRCARRHPHRPAELERLPESTRRAILEWIGNAKTSATRQARIERTARDAAINIRANQWRQPKGSRT